MHLNKDWKGQIYLIGHTGAVNSLVVLEDNLLASASDDSTIRIWNTVNGKKIKIITSNYIIGVSCLAILPDNYLASSNNWDTYIKIWDYKNGKLVKNLIGHTDYVRSLVVLPNNLLVSDSKYGELRIWDIKNGISKIILSNFNYSYSYYPSFDSKLIALSDNYLADTYNGYTIRIINIKNRYIEKRLTGHIYNVESLVKLSDSLLASGSFSEIKIWNVAKGILMKTLNIIDYAKCLVVLSNNLLASASFSSISIWNITNGNMINKFIHIDQVRSLAALPDGSLVSGLYNGQISIWTV